jgi:hypothetical protein
MLCHISRFIFWTRITINLFNLCLNQKKFPSLSQFLYYHMSWRTLYGSNAGCVQRPTVLPTAIPATELYLPLALHMFLPSPTFQTPWSPMSSSSHWRLECRFWDLWWGLDEAQSWTGTCGYACMCACARVCGAYGLMCMVDSFFSSQYSLGIPKRAPAFTCSCNLAKF